AVSTLISAFNSLTLSPALSALLLRPRVKGRFEALPWFGFIPVGAWVGHKLLGGWVVRWLGGWYASHFAAPPPDSLLWWGPGVAGALAGLVVGLTLGRPLNYLMGWSFAAFNRGFEWATAGYTRAVGGLLRVSVPALAVYAGLLALTWWSFAHTPTGFIP